MTITGDELFLYVVVPSVVALLVYTAYLEIKYGNPYEDEYEQRFRERLKRRYNDEREKIAECIRMQHHFMENGDLQMAAFWQKVRKEYERREEYHRRAWLEEFKRKEGLE